MQLVERHVISRAARFAVIDAASLAAKNLYNAANYIVRQSFIQEGVYLHYHEMHRTNQQFVAIPHARFVELLSYKAELVGIRVIVTEESYTSKASFLDADPLPIFGVGEAPRFSGRVKRGLYRAADGTAVNADVNGAYNIIRKAVPEAFAQGRRGCVVHPMRLAV
jgi:IS605 OrfB family transposase